MRIVVLSGGVGGARFLLGVRALTANSEFLTSLSADSSGLDGTQEVTAIVNTGDDVTLHGLRICPDLDSVMYTLGGGIDSARGWGRAGETWTVKEELAGYGAEPTWFGLGDKDIATHLIRTRMLDSGYSLSAVTEALCARWQPGITLLPMTDDRVETHVVVADPDAPSGRRALHFQEWWIRHHGELEPQSFVAAGAEASRPAAGVSEAIAGADVILLAPSNPVVSIGMVLAVPGIRDALRSATAPIVGLSPIIGGAPLRGMAERCLPSIGVEVSATGVGQHYGARGDGGLLDGWLVDTADAATQIPGVAVRAIPLYMTDERSTAEMARAALTFALEFRDA
jgi:LPPG:FO 2-phospho-L-lactate transferase